MSLTCEQLEMHLTAFVFDELDDAMAAQQVRAHLEACPLCRAKLQQLRCTIDTLNAAVAEMPSPVLSDDRRAALREAVSADASTSVDAAPVTYKFANWKRPLALAASVALLGTAGVGIYQSMLSGSAGESRPSVAMTERWSMKEKSAEEASAFADMDRSEAVDMSTRQGAVDKDGYYSIADTPATASAEPVTTNGSFGVDRKQTLGDDMLALQSRGLNEDRAGEARRDVSQRYFAAKPGEKADNAKREIALGEVMTPMPSVEGESLEYRSKSSLKAGDVMSRGREVAANAAPEMPDPAARPMSKAAAAPAPSQPMPPAKPAAPRPEFSGDAGGLGGGGNANVAGKLADAKQAAENKPTAQTASGPMLGAVAQTDSRSETTPGHAMQQKVPLPDKQLAVVDAAEQAKPLNQTAREGLEAAQMQKGADGAVALAEDYADVSKLRRAQADARRGEAMKKAKDQLPAAPADASAPREAPARQSGERGEALKDIEAEQQMRQLDNTVALRDADKEAVNGRRLNRMYEQINEAKIVNAEQAARQEVAEVEHQQKVQELLRRANDLRREMKYDAAADTLNQLLYLDPDNVAAKAMNEMMQDAILYRNTRPMEQQRVVEQTLLKPQAEPAEDVTLPPASSFRQMPVNPFVMTQRDKFSTFAIDVDTASYALSRKYLRSGFVPPAGAVRMEEFVNNFDYNYPAQADRTFAVHVDGARAPFGDNLTLVKIGVKAKTLGRDGRKPAHLVFVVDASGSMDKPDRLPLVQQSLKMLAGQLDAADHVSIVTYGTRASLVTEYSGEGDDGQKKIAQAVDAIATGGSTNMIDGLKLGYDIARRHFRAGYINHIVLCSDGVANVGETEAAAMLDQVAGARKQGITLTSVGFGIGAYNDAMMEQLANRGDGQYVFVDSAAEARRVFVDRLASTLQTVARDAKIQVEFDPARVRRYRLIGYENRDIADKDFRNDAIDAGEVGSGQSATALYEVELIGDDSADLGAVYVRYRDVDTDAVDEISYRLRSGEIDNAATPKSHPRLYLAAAAAEFAEIMRSSEHARGASLDAVERVLIDVTAALPLDQQAAELLDLIRQARGLPRAP